MAEYDDTNRGAAFTPFPTQSMILQGKLNVEGEDSKIVLVKDQTRDGTNIIEVFAKVGVLFDNKGKEGAPDYTGPYGDTKRLAGWRRMKDNKPYMSFAISDKQDSTAAQPNSGGGESALPNDDIPF